MADGRYDVVVIGGGIQGAGVAQAAAAAGFDVLLLEKTEPAIGTSSRSSKLIHGGLRYLETGQFALVRESLYERNLLLKNAPQLVQLVPFYIPIYAQTTRRPWQIRIGLSLYALLGGLGKGTRFRSLPRSEWTELGAIRTEGLQAVFEYWDGQTDDRTLTQAVVQSAVQLGATAVYPADFQTAQRTETGYHVTYQLDDQIRECETAILVNAAGPWINIVRDRVDPSPPRMDIELVQGAHIVLDKQISRGILYAEAPADKRAVFIMPWRDKTLVGTTETVYKGSPDDVRALPDEIDYLLETLEYYVPNHGAMVVDSFAGLRVLPAGKESPFRRNRETTLLTDNEARPAYVAVYGGKLTGYRATAEKVLRLIRPSLPSRPHRADTRTLHLPSDPHA